MYTRAKEIGRKVMVGGENRMMQPAAPRCGQVAQVDRFVADVVEKDTIHIHQRRAHPINHGDNSLVL